MASQLDNRINTINQQRNELEQERSALGSEVLLKLRRLKNKRKKLVRQLRLYNSDIDASVPLQDIDRDILRQQDILDRLPCVQCPNCDICGRGKKHPFNRLAAEAAWISRVFNDARDALWIEFNRHCDFLVLNGIQYLSIVIE